MGMDVSSARDVLLRLVNTNGPNSSTLSGHHSLKCSLTLSGRGLGICLTILFFSFCGDSNITFFKSENEFCGVNGDFATSCFVFHETERVQFSSVDGVYDITGFYFSMVYGQGVYCVYDWTNSVDFEFFPVSRCHGNCFDAEMGECTVGV